MLPKTEIKDVCVYPEDGYKDRCLRLPIKGCDNCWYHRVKIIPVNKGLGQDDKRDDVKRQK